MSGFQSLFRVFDLAFFAPGALLLMTALHIELVSPPTGALDASITDVPGLLYVGAIVGLAFILGVSQHGLREGLLTMVDVVTSNAIRTKTRTREFPAAWYRQFGTERRAEMASYFWYMRATASNLALATLVCGVCIGLRDSDPRWFSTVVLSLALARLARRFDNALLNAAVPRDMSLPAPATDSDGPGEHECSR